MHENCREREIDGGISCFAFRRAFFYKCAIVVLEHVGKGTEEKAANQDRPLRKFAWFWYR